MKKTLTILFACIISNFTFAQTSIPDSNFEQELINLGLDVGTPDGTVPTANIDTLTFLNINSLNISDITGIEDFSALTLFGCAFNQLTSINVTQNLALTTLNCNTNLLNNLDVTQNTALTNLNCSFNSLTSLDAAQNTALTSFNCQNNTLTCLNIRNGNNTNLPLISATNNPNLNCIEVDNVNYSTTNWTLIDPQTSFSTNCNNTCSTVGINEYSYSNFNIYPNPALNQLTIETELATSKVSIVDLTGKTITTINRQTKQIDVAYLPSGIYFIKITTDEKTITRKFVKQ
jgi:Secretion system C-terminal sorting domain